MMSQVLRKQEYIGVGFGFAKEGEFEEAGADYVVNSAKELTDFILELQGYKTVALMRNYTGYRDML